MANGAIHNNVSFSLRKFIQPDDAALTEAVVAWQCPGVSVAVQTNGTGLTVDLWPFVGGTLLGRFACWSSPQQLINLQQVVDMEGRGEGRGASVTQLCRLAANRAFHNVFSSL